MTNAKDREFAARVAHEALRVCRLQFDDASMCSWDSSSELQRDVSRTYVDRMLLGISAKTQHANWRDDRLAAGWKRGPAVDQERKEHPFLCAYKDLPFEQRLKDDMFVRVAQSVIDSLSCQCQTSNS